MKFPVLKVLLACLPFVATASGLCQQQDAKPERPYLLHTEPPRLYFSSLSTENAGPVELSASDAQLTFSPRANLTSADIESVLQLRGNVQVRMCAPSSHGCEKWSILLRADAVDYNEKTGGMDARGDVHIDPYTASTH